MAKLYAGGQIRTLRTARGLTQAEMARALDLSTSYLNQLENDQRPLTAPVLVQLTTVFGVDAAFFSGDAERRTAAAATLDAHRRRRAEFVIVAFASSANFRAAGLG